MLVRLENDYLGLLLIRQARSCFIPLLTFLKVEVMLCILGLLKALGVGLLFDLWLFLRLLPR